MDKVRQITFFLLRVVSGLLFTQAGGMKILDWFGGIPAEFGGHPAFLTQVWIGGVLELFGGFAVMIGLFTQPVAFILSGRWPSHTSNSTSPTGPGPSRTTASRRCCFATFSSSSPLTARGRGARTA